MATPLPNLCRSSPLLLLLLLHVVLSIQQLCVVVVVADLPRVLSQPGRRFLARGMPAQLDCPAEANPPVTAVRWTKNGRPVDTGRGDGTTSSTRRLTVSDRGALTFHAVSVDDAGRYSCTPFSQLGEGRASIPVVLIVKGQSPSSALTSIIASYNFCSLPCV